jgi:hypothetical protein
MPCKCEDCANFHQKEPPKKLQVIDPTLEEQKILDGHKGPLERAKLLQKMAIAGRLRRSA